MSQLVIFGWVGPSRVSMSLPLLFLAGLVGLVWAELDYQKYVSVFLCHSKNRKDAGGTCHWLGGVQFSYVVCRFLVREGVLLFCMLGILVSGGILFQSMHRSLGMRVIQFS